MFAKFDLELQEEELNKYCKRGLSPHNKGLEILNEHQEIFKDTLKPYLDVDGRFDASTIEKEWFPKINAQVFLSHSHADEQSVLKLASLLKEKYGVTCFVDSVVWKYADELIEKFETSSRCIYLKKLPCKEERYKYASRVYMLLQGALAKMMNTTECVVFVNTHNSVLNISNRHLFETTSPWIYNERLMATLLQARPLEEQRLSVVVEDKQDEWKFKVPKDDSFRELKLEDFEKAFNQLMNDTKRIGNKRLMGEKVLEYIYVHKAVY